MMASEQMSVKPFCHRQVSRANDLDSRAKAQPIMAPRNDFRDTKAEYMTVRRHRTKHVLAKREGSIHDKRGLFFRCARGLALAVSSLTGQQWA